jgi:hypothetical protein
MRRLAFVAAVLVVVAPAAPAWADRPPPSRVPYAPPVDAPVADWFRAPPKPWLAGNRGLDYAVPAGTPVAASAAGEVVFAGLVGGSRHVVVLHADGIRTSYSFLSSIGVHRGQRVVAGDVVGEAGDGLHFGARAGDQYLDPALLLAGEVPEVHLVPDADLRPATVAGERTALARFLDGTRRVAAGVAARAAQRAAAAVPGAAPVARATIDWWRQRGRCTPPQVSPPPTAGRHLVVLVGGLGSSSEEAAVDDVDTASLGYAPPDVVRFSYRGGTTATTPYRPADTGVDLRLSARRLRALLQDLSAANPGVPVDVIAHSQGGVVARAAVSQELDGADPRQPVLGALVTLGSPHGGADLGTAGALLGRTGSGQVVGAMVSRASGGGLDPRWESVRQLAVGSSFLRGVADSPLPAGLPVTSIAARGDIVVTAGRTRLDGAETVTVTVAGLASDHGALPGSAAARREIALGLAGMPPTCQTWVDTVADHVVPAGIAATEQVAALKLWQAAVGTDVVIGPTRAVAGAGSRR